jgi:hypothetical protein
VESQARAAPVWKINEARKGRSIAKAMVLLFGFMLPGAGAFLGIGRLNGSAALV